MWTERRTPQSVVSVTTSQDRGVAPGERIKYSHASSTKPRPPADVRDTGIPQPHAEDPDEGRGSQNGTQPDDRRHGAGHRVGPRLVPTTARSHRGSSSRRYR